MSSPAQSARVARALLLLVAACDSIEAADAPRVDGDDERGSAWVEVGATRFASDGESGTVTIPAQAAAAVALRVTTDPGVCFQLSSVVDGDSRVGIDGRSPGAYCRACELRTSITVGAGVFVLPVDPGALEPDSGLSLRFARVDCETLTPRASADDAPPLVIEAQAIAAAPERAAIDLRFLIAPSSILFGDEERRQALLTALADALASAGIVPRLVESRELAAMPAELRFHAGDQESLAAVLAGAPTGDEGVIDVVFGGCLEYDDPIFGPPSPVHGFTPRIPGGAGPADAVFMAGVDCFTAAAGPIDPPIDAQARVLAHELGHTLGLYHAVEADGGIDQLADTGPDNIMHYNPERAASRGFSRSQGRVMRMHPAARPLE